MDAPHHSKDSGGNFAAGFMLAIPLSLAAWFALCWLAMNISTHVYSCLIALTFATGLGFAVARFHREVR